MFKFFATNVEISKHELDGRTAYEELLDINFYDCNVIQSIELTRDLDNRRQITRVICQATPALRRWTTSCYRGIYLVQ